MEEWKEYKLSEVATLTTGFPFDGHKYGKEGIRVVRGDNVTIGSLRWDTDKDKRWNEPFERASEFSLYADDIVIGMDGSRVGRNRAQVKLEDLPLYIAQRVACIRHNELSLQSFLYYQIFNQAFENYIKAVQTGTSIPHVSLKQIGDYPIILPSLKVQQSIASILKSLDDKIEVNRQINVNLEQQAQALFKSCFVDFDPFKDGEFVESELGKIPKGWRVAKIKDIPHTLNTGKRPKGGAITSGVPSIGAEQLKGLCNYDYTKTKYISKEYSQSIPKGKVIGYEVYLNRVGGKPGDYIQNTTMFGEGYPYENCYINDHVFKLDFMQNRGYNVYVYFTFLTSRIQKYLNACGGKAAIPVINKQNIDDIYVFLPENEYVKKFGKSVLPMINMIFKIGLESARLATLRDTLLPRLMSGELSVNDLKE